MYVDETRCNLRSAARRSQCEGSQGTRASLDGQNYGRARKHDGWVGREGRQKSQLVVGRDPPRSPFYRTRPTLNASSILVETSLDFIEHGPTGADLANIGPDSVETGPNMIGPKVESKHPAQIWSLLAQLWPHLLGIWSHPARTRPRPAHPIEIGSRQARTRLKAVPNLVDFSPSFVEASPNLVEFSLNLVEPLSHFAEPGVANIVKSSTQRFCRNRAPTSMSPLKLSPNTRSKLAPTLGRLWLKASRNQRRVGRSYGPEIWPNLHTVARPPRSRSRA